MSISIKGTHRSPIT